MVSAALVETRTCDCQSGRTPTRKGSNSVTRKSTVTILMIVLLAGLQGCAAKQTLPPGVHASVEVGPPLKSEAWKGVATAADKDRLARLGLAWQEALDDAKKSDPAEVRGEGKLLLPRSGLPWPDVTPGSYNCR